MPRPIPTILTLDASSTATGAALWSGGKLIATETFAFKGDYSRLSKQGDAFQVFLQKHVAYLDRLEVWIEEPFYSPGKSNVLPIFMTHGILLYVFNKLATNYCWNYVSVNTWRKLLIEGRVASAEAKKIVMGLMAAKFKINVTNDNIGDALGILNWRLAGGFANG